MNFTNRIDIRNSLEKLKRVPHDPSKSANQSFFGKIDIDCFYIDIMAGTIACCHPRVQFDYLGHYKKITVGIYEVIKEQEHAISPNQDDRFNGFPWLKYFTYTTTKGISKPSYMGEMIPMDEVVSLIRDLYKVSRLKIFF